MRGAVALLLLSLAGGLVAGCEQASQAGPAVAVNPVQLYGQNCARCHGADGRGDPEMKKTMPTIRDFSQAQFRATSTEQLEQVIMVGRNQMPGFGAALSKSKIHHLAGYVRRLGEQAAGAPTAPSPGAR